jgi:hypothetical protein
LSALASDAGKTQDEERWRRWREEMEKDARMEEEVAEEPGRMRREEFPDFGPDENDETENWAPATDLGFGSQGQYPQWLNCGCSRGK